jgi:single-strand DNA-binding protein
MNEEEPSMATYNRFIMIGNLTRDPEYKQLASGRAVCRLGLASNRQYRNKQNGELVQEVCFIDVDVWGAQAESCRQYLQKGRPVLVEGRLKYETWQDAQGQNRSKHSVVADRVTFLGNQQEFGSADRADEFEEDTTPHRLDPNNPVEKNLMDQIEGIKQRARKNKKDEAPAGVGELAFTDEPPFQDELPF